MTLRRLIRTGHKWLSLAMLLPWLLQAATGVLLVFHWEIDDALLPAPRAATDPAALARRIAAVADDHPGFRVISLRVTAGAPDRYDLVAERDSESLVLRVDGAGNVLRTRSGDEMLANGGFIKTLDRFHQTWLAGDAGSWFVGVSGLLLLTNIALGVQMAWPRAGAWAAALRPPRARAAATRFHGWHRAIGLSIAGPLALLVLCGVSLVFLDGLFRLAGVGSAEPRAPVGGRAGAPIPMVEAIAAARRPYPRATLVGVDFPDAARPWYAVALRQPGEATRVYGSTLVYVGATDAAVLGRVDPFAMQPVERVLDWLYPVHTGEIAGTFGRVVVLVLGALLATTAVFGLRLWLARGERP